MFSPLLMEKIAKEQQYDFLREVETARLLKEINGDAGSQKTKLAVVLSGVVLIALMIAQMV
jgi:hypothetical protein